MSSRPAAGRQSSKLEGAASKMKSTHFKKDYTINHDLFQVVREGDVALLDRLLHEERNKSDSRWSGWSLLHRAAETGQTDVCQLLIDRGADVNARTIRGWHTPLHLSLSAGYLDTSLLLAEYGADVKKKNKYQQDPTAYAISRGYNILTAEFNQALFNRRITAISEQLKEEKASGVEKAPSGAFSRQSSVSWHDWATESQDTAS